MLGLQQDDLNSIAADRDILPAESRTLTKLRASRLDAVLGVKRTSQPLNPKPCQALQDCEWALMHGPRTAAVLVIRGPSISGAKRDKYLRFLKGVYRVPLRISFKGVYKDYYKGYCGGLVNRGLKSYRQKTSSGVPLLLFFSEMDRKTRFYLLRPLY